MKMMTFTSSVPSHVYTGLHLLEQMCRLRLVSAQRCSINENNNFTLSVPSHVYAGLHLLEQLCRLRLVGAQQ
jgi:hypothetical protein